MYDLFGGPEQTAVQFPMLGSGIEFKHKFRIDIRILLAWSRNQTYREVSSPRNMHLHTFCFCQQCALTFLNRLMNMYVALLQPLMESLKKAMADAKKPRPIQDLLKEQMAKLREQASGGGGGNGNRRGGSGGSGGPEDESFKETLDEIVQVILATVAFILVVITSSLLHSWRTHFIS